MAGRIVNHKTGGLETIRLGDMRPLQVGKIIEGEFIDSIVWRTASLSKFEVMDLSGLVDGSRWEDDDVDIKVELLPKGEKVILELYND